MSWWASARSAGVTTEEYLRSTPVELQALLDEINKRTNERAEAAALRAGMICATILNSQRTKRSDRVWQPVDFVKTRRHEDQTMEEMVGVMNTFTRALGG